MDQVESIQSGLRRRARRFWGKVTVMILLGVPLSLVMPLIAATVLWPVMALLGLYFDALRWVGWLWLFDLLTLVLVPLLYILEMWAGGDYLCQALRDTRAYGSLGAALLAGPVGERGELSATGADPRSTSWCAAVFLGGPRLVLGAARRIEVAWRLRAADRKRAAGILAILLTEKEGVDTTRRLCAEEELENLVPTLAYLVFHRWIGMRDRWEHIWLFSESRVLLGGPSAP